jgi:hypothetical protein
MSWHQESPVVFGPGTTGTGPPEARIVTAAVAGTAAVR